MSLYFSAGSPSASLSPQELKNGLFTALGRLGERSKVLCLPPDFTRFHSHAGVLTAYAWEYYGPRLTDVLPAIGTHAPMTADEIHRMFGEMPLDLFRVHDWRNGLVTLGEVPASFIQEQSEGKLDYPWPAQVDRLLVDGGFDLILSIGQVVPHEVIGMANYNKNVFVGTGGVDGINRSHYLGAVVGLERIIGRADTAVRRVLNYASDHFAKQLPIIYVQTVVDKDANGKLVVRGMFVGDDVECFHKAAELSLQVNFQMLDREIRKCIVYLDPSEFKSTWLGNKAIYRTRMALAGNADLIVLAPGVKEFGEDPTIDKLIRKYGYINTPPVLRAVKEDADLAASLGVAAHLIHGSSENRFKITYCPGHLTREEIESVNFSYAPLDDMMKRYDPAKLTDGFNMVDGEEIFYVSNPALGLWSYRERFR
ncbi:MAG: lactate racemase domain-containing protein [Acidobacteriales bacterium]|nr:lactate racemase domain-containing protein [Terriglobales bacterium]